MTTTHARTDASGTIQDDHRFLKVRLAWLHQQLASAALTAVDAERELSEMEAELEAHYAHEESDGFFTEIVDVSPELSDKVESLLQQHRHFRVMFRALRKTCRWACTESGTRAGWLAEFAEFHHCFDEHECAEHELLHEALQRDVGAAD